MKRIDIEAILAWAYVEELPKARRDPPLIDRAPRALSAGEWIGEMGVPVDADRVNQFGVTPCLSQYGGDEPHPDAVTLAGLVDGLDQFEIDVPDGWNPFADLIAGAGAALWPEIEAAAATALDRVAAPGQGGVRRFRIGLAQLVRKHAILGGCPDWEAETPALRYVCHDNGKPRWFRLRQVTEEGAFGPIVHEHEADGFDRVAQRPFPDAYRKTRLEPDPLEAGIGRAEYEVWHAALGLLVAQCEGLMLAHAVTGPRRTLRPWEALALA